MYLKKFSLIDKKISKINYLYFLVPCILIGFFSAVRWPSAWTATHALFDYSQGFSKRSLYGNFLSFFFENKISYLDIAIINFSIFFVWLLTLVILIKKLVDKKLIDYKIACVFFLSPGFIFQVHTIGYLEHVAYFLFLLSFFIRNLLIHLISKFLIILILPFIHEGLLLMIVPAILFDTYLILKKNNLKYKMLIGIMFFVTIIGTGYNSITNKSEIELKNYEKYIHDKALDFNARGDNVETLRNDIVKAFIIMQEYWSRLTHWVKLFMGLIFLLPLPIFLFFILIKSHREKFGRIKDLTFYFIILSCFAPMLLIPIAFDIWRWFAMIQFTTFITIFIYCYRIGVNLKLKNYTYLFNLLFIITVLTSIPLMDGYQVNNLPFYNHLEDVWFSFKNNENFIIIPWHR